MVSKTRPYHISMHTNLIGCTRKKSRITNVRKSNIINVIEGIFQITNGNQKQHSF